MGASCCKVSKNKSLAGGGQVEVSQYRNVRHSPPWSFRWDNRTHILDIMDTSSPASEPDLANFNGSEIKRMPTLDRRVSSDSSSTLGHDKESKSSTSTSHQEQLCTSSQKKPRQSSKPTLPLTSSSSSKIRSDKTSTGKSPLSRNKRSQSSFSSDAQSTSASPTPAYRTQSLPSDTSTSSKSPLSQIMRQTSGSSHSHPASFNHDTNHWTFHTFTELVASSQKTKQSFDSHKFNFIHADTRRSNSDASRTSSKGPICNICMKLLTERSPYGMQKIYSTNELAVAAVLECGHVFHADCLEKLTPDVDRYDPECPRCTYGYKDLNKMILNHGNDNKISKISSKKPVDMLKSHSVRGSSGKPPFLKRYSSEGESSRKKGFFARFRD